MTTLGIVILFGSSLILLALAFGYFIRARRYYEDAETVCHQNRKIARQNLKVLRKGTPPIYANGELNALYFIEELEKKQLDK
jgi:hypothetical protein